jgi:hypothetical protein
VACFLRYCLCVCHQVLELPDTVRLGETPKNVSAIVFYISIPLKSRFVTNSSKLFLHTNH